MEELIQILDDMASQPKSEVLHIRLSEAERQALAKLAQAYKKNMSAVLTSLIRQGIIDYYQDGECFALSAK